MRETPAKTVHIAQPIDGYFDPVEFYFDFSSPYGYFASTQIQAIAEQYGRTVNWRPILLGAVFKVTGQQPLPGIPLKGAYTRHDLERSARYFGVPFRMPSRFPIGTTAACRAFYAITDRDPSLARRLAEALYSAYFVEDRDISTTDVVIDVAAELEIDRGSLAKSLTEAALKDRLRAEVDAAIAQGVFGSPYFVVDGEPFWGSDRLEQIAKWLRSGGW